MDVIDQYWSGPPRFKPYPSEQRLRDIRLHVATSAPRPYPIPAMLNISTASGPSQTPSSSHGTPISFTTPYWCTKHSRETTEWRTHKKLDLPARFYLV